MGEECSTCKTCLDQQEIKSNETRFTGTRIITNNNKNNIRANNNNNNNNNNSKNNLDQPMIIAHQNKNNQVQKE